MDWKQVSAKLAEPLDRAAIKPPAPGKYGDYIDGFHAIMEANRIFGHAGWSYAITALALTCRYETEGKRGPMVRVGYLCRVAVTVDGVTREGAAGGSGVAAQNSETDAHESAIKEAETDALKRALRSFGHTFGLALYEKTADKKPAGNHIKEQFDCVGFARFFNDGLGKCKSAKQIETVKIKYSDELKRLEGEDAALHARIIAVCARRIDALSQT